MRKLFLISIFLLLGGCSSTFVYNNLDWMVHWYVDDYIDLDKSQRKTFDKKFEIWHSWHRKEELGKYKAQIEQIKNKIENNQLTEDYMQSQFDLIREHWISIRGRIVPDLAEMALFLSEKQVTALFDELAEDNKEEQEKHDELYAKSDEERLKKRQKDIEENLKEWVGKLTEEQKGIVAKYVPQFRSNWQEWIIYHKTVLVKAKTMFEGRSDNAAFKDELIQLMSNPESYRHPKMVENSEFNGALYTALVVEISGTLTGKQRKKLFRKLDGYIDDISDLIED